MSADALDRAPGPDVMEAAADWLDRLDDLSPDEQAAFKAWLAASDHNRRALAMMESLLLDDALREAVDNVRTAPQPVVPAAGLARRVDRRPRLRPAQLGLAAAAALAGIAVLGLILPRTQPPTPEHPAGKPVEYATTVGVREDATLNDRSVVHLDADSAVSVAFTARARDVRLERGQAMFEVTHDPARPFDVDARGATVTAVGTIFDVDLVGDAVEVRVFRGVVRVRSPGGDVRLLHVGEQLFLSGDHRVVWGRFAPDLTQTWRSDWLKADNMPLGQVVTQLNRYARKPIVLQSDSLSGAPLSGRFDLRRTDATVAMLSTLLDLEVSRDARNIYLARKPLTAAAPATGPWPGTPRHGG